MPQCQRRRSELDSPIGIGLKACETLGHARLLATRDGMSSERHVWIIGATSAIAHSYARRRAESAASFLLFGRNEVHLKANAADLIARGAKSVLFRRHDLAWPTRFHCSRCRRPRLRRSTGRSFDRLRNQGSATRRRATLIMFAK